MKQKSYTDPTWNPTWELRVKETKRGREEERERGREGERKSERGEGKEKFEEGKF